MLMHVYLYSSSSLALNRIHLSVFLSFLSFVWFPFSYPNTSSYYHYYFITLLLLLRFIRVEVGGCGSFYAEFLWLFRKLSLPLSDRKPQFHVYITSPWVRVSSIMLSRSRTRETRETSPSDDLAAVCERTNTRLHMLHCFTSFWIKVLVTEGESDTLQRNSGCPVLHLFSVSKKHSTHFIETLHLNKMCAQFLF